MPVDAIPPRHELIAQLNISTDADREASQQLNARDLRACLRAGVKPALYLAEKRRLQKSGEI